jgi:CelD/BcsL family acetyltransferase involved in cellulose biosynthesis
LELKVWDQPDALAQLRQPWQELFDKCPDASIFLSWEWIFTWWSHFHDGAAPHIVTIDDGDGLVGLAPLMKHADNGSNLCFMQRDETTDYADVLALPTSRAKSAQLVVDHLEAECQSGGAVVLEPLPEDSPVLDLVRGGPNPRLQAIQPCPTVTLANSWDEYLGGLRKKDRHELRRKIRRAETAGNLQCTVATTAEALDVALKDFYRLHQSSSDPKKAQFLEPHLQAFFSEAAHTLARRGWLRLSVLHLDGVAIASLLSFDRGTTVSLYNSGLDPEFRWLSPGIIIIAEEIQSAIAAGRVTYDFLRGDEPYKYDFGAHDRFVWRVTLGEESSRA